MSPTIGFVLVTHNKPSQISRLIHLLNRMFDRPPIACHHDFFQSDFPDDARTSNVDFVRPHFRTAWATFSVVEAIIGATRLLYRSKSSPDWFVVLSGADYPICSAAKILDDLAASPYDAHIAHVKITGNAHLGHWVGLCHERYCNVKLTLPVINKHGRRDRWKLVLRHPWMTSRLLPFSETFPCLAGETWFCANRKSAEYLLDFHDSKPALARHYRRGDPFVICPEESYQQTVLCNAPGLKASQNHWRYIDWSEKQWHPKTLGIEDLPAMRASSAHFARKFDLDSGSQVLDALDALIT